MGLFDFSKAGPGVEKGAPRKKGIFLFFELLGRKFWKFLQVNMLYFLVSIPMVIISLVAANFFVTYSANILGVGISGYPVFFVQACNFVSCLFLVFLGSGPASAALAYFNRQAIREKPVYIMADFFDNFKKNFSQGIIVGIINPVVTFMLLFVMLFYGARYLESGNAVWFLFMVIIFVVSLVFVSASFYLYQLMITFENTIFELYKNAVILALINIPQNLFFGLILAISGYVIFFTLNPVVSFFVAFIGLISIMRFVIEFYTARVIEKRLLKDAGIKEVK